jgi:hypothetical protein
MNAEAMATLMMKRGEDELQDCMRRLKHRHGLRALYFCLHWFSVSSSWLVVCVVIVTPEGSRKAESGRGWSVRLPSSMS